MGTLNLGRDTHQKSAISAVTKTLTLCYRMWAYKNLPSTARTIEKPRCMQFYPRIIRHAQFHL